LRITYRQGAGEVDHGGLGAGVDGHLVDGIESSHGSNVADDSSRTSLALVPEVQDGGGGVDQASVVHGNGALDLVIVQDASSVDQDIDGLQLGEDGLQQLGGLGDGHGHIVGVEGDGHLGIDCLQLGNGSRVVNAVEDHQVLIGGIIMLYFYPLRILRRPTFRSRLTSSLLVSRPMPPRPATKITFLLVSVNDMVTSVFCAGSFDLFRWEGALLVVCLQFVSAPYL